MPEPETTPTSTPSPVRPLTWHQATLRLEQLTANTLAAARTLHDLSGKAPDTAYGFYFPQPDPDSTLDDTVDWVVLEGNGWNVMALAIDDAFVFFDLSTETFIEHPEQFQTLGYVKPRLDPNTTIFSKAIHFPAGFFDTRPKSPLELLSLPQRFLGLLLPLLPALSLNLLFNSLLPLTVSFVALVLVLWGGRQSLLNDHALLTKTAEQFRNGAGIPIFSRRRNPWVMTILGLLIINVFLSHFGLPAAVVLALLCTLLTLGGEFEFLNRRVSETAREQARLLVTTPAPVRTQAASLTAGIHWQAREEEGRKLLETLRSRASQATSPTYADHRARTALHTDWPRSRELIGQLPPEEQEDVALEHLHLLDEITAPAKPDTAELEAHTRYLKDLARH